MIEQVAATVLPYKRAIRAAKLSVKVGYVTKFVGLMVEATVPNAFVGELCEVLPANSNKRIPAEVVGFGKSTALLMPFGDLRGIKLGSEVFSTGRTVSVPVGEKQLGRVINAFGEPLDNGDRIEPDAEVPLYGEMICPSDRAAISETAPTHIKAIDGLLTIGKGQRVGIFAGSGVGKSTLLSMLARNVEADVVVTALIGERGREVIEFTENQLGPELMKRTIVVAATSEQSPLVRTHAAFSATAIAEYFCRQGKHVVLLLDSATRLAMAQREIGLSIGEPPTAKGYTPSAFALLPKLVERCGNFKHGGAITAFYTVLVEGDDMSEPVSDALRATLDGHIVLSRKIASRGMFPSIDLLSSNSRLLSQLSTDIQIENVRKVQRAVATYAASEELVELGAYKKGSNPQLDSAIELKGQYDVFMQQGERQQYTLNEIQQQVSALAAKWL